MFILLRGSDQFQNEISIYRIHIFKKKKKICVISYVKRKCMYIYMV